jgi:O-acetylhomoserine (thiol)-lyase
LPYIEACASFSHLANVGDCRSLVIHPALDDAFPHGRRRPRAGRHHAGDDFACRSAIEDPETTSLDDLKRALRAAEERGVR